MFSSCGPACITGRVQPQMDGAAKKMKTVEENHHPEALGRTTKGAIFPDNNFKLICFYNYSLYDVA